MLRTVSIGNTPQIHFNDAILREGWIYLSQTEEDGKLWEACFNNADEISANLTRVALRHAEFCCLQLLPDGSSDDANRCLNSWVIRSYSALCRDALKREADCIIVQIDWFKGEGHGLGWNDNSEEDGEQFSKVNH